MIANYNSHDRLPAVFVQSIRRYTIRMGHGIARAWMFGALAISGCSGSTFKMAQTDVVDRYFTNNDIAACGVVIRSLNKIVNLDGYFTFYEKLDEEAGIVFRPSDQDLYRRFETMEVVEPTFDVKIEEAVRRSIDESGKDLSTERHRENVRGWAVKGNGSCSSWKPSHFLLIESYGVPAKEIRLRTC
jgi:hypothetical protein